MKLKYYLIILFFFSGVLCAQEGIVVVTGHSGYVDGPSFWNMVTSQGPLGVLNWFGIIFGGGVLLPLGIISSFHCGKVEPVAGWPLSTKLLFWDTLSVCCWGFTGLAQGAIGSFQVICGGNGSSLALSLGFAFYFFMIAFFIVQVGLFFLAISMIFRHFKCKNVVAQ